MKFSTHSALPGIMRILRSHMLLHVMHNGKPELLQLQWGVAGVTDCGGCSWCGICAAGVG